MSAETLRMAANMMRENNRQDVVGDPVAATLVAVADWLDACARVDENATFSGWVKSGLTDHAMTVAAAYLGDPA